MKKSAQYAILFIIQSIITSVMYIQYNTQFLIAYILLLVWLLTNYIINEIKDK